MANLNVNENITDSNLPNQINIKVSEKDVEMIDHEIEKLERLHPGLKVSRSEMAKILLNRGLGIKND